MMYFVILSFMVLKHYNTAFCKMTKSMTKLMTNFFCHCADMTNFCKMTNFSQNDKVFCHAWRPVLL